jgi:uncharacterized protein (TIGR03663 family)
MRKRTLVFSILMGAIAAAALWLRAHELSRRPMHHDEANQAVRCGIMLESGVYRYDPREHHGPILYYLTLPALRLTGAPDLASATETAFRIVPVLFGVGTILLLFLLRDALGRLGTFAAAALMAISPAMVYYSRFYIQETLLVFFTAAAIACVWRYSRRLSGLWALIGGAAAGMMHASKETCIINFFGIAVAWLVCRPGKDRQDSIFNEGSHPPPSHFQIMQERNELRQRARNHLIAGSVAAISVSVFLFSVFFMRWKGVLDSVFAYSGYFHRASGESTSHIHAWDYYLRTLFWTRSPGLPPWSETVIPALALIGTAAAFLTRGPERRFLRFLVVYTLCITVVYSLIPYKTPWCSLSILYGLVLLAGAGVQFVANTRRIVGPIVAGVLLLTGSAHLWGQMWRANFKLPSDPRNPYVYAQTVPDFLRLVKRVDQISDASPRHRDSLIAVVTTHEEAWPLPWYLRGYNNVGYWTALEQVPKDLRPAVWISSQEFTDALESRTSGMYRIEYYGLRPDVLLAVFIRSDLWDAFIRARQEPERTRERQSSHERQGI